MLSFIGETKYMLKTMSLLTNPNLVHISITGCLTPFLCFSAATYPKFQLILSYSMVVIDGEQLIQDSNGNGNEKKRETNPDLVHIVMHARIVVIEMIGRSSL